MAILQEILTKMNILMEKIKQQEEMLTTMVTIVEDLDKRVEKLEKRGKK